MSNPASQPTDNPALAAKAVQPAQPVQAAKPAQAAKAVQAAKPINVAQPGSGKATRAAKASRSGAPQRADFNKLSTLERMLASMVRFDASDLHLKSNNPVIMRVHGDMTAISQENLSSEDIRRILFEILSDEQKETYVQTGDLDFAHVLHDGQRFRFNVFRERRRNTVVVRRIAMTIPSFESLNLPGDTFRTIAGFDDGMVIVAGVTGSGKSTTIAGMLDYINAHKNKHIITVEDPIEFEFKNKKSFVSQREIGVDCKDLAAAIRTLVRQDPDVVLIGEMRDIETFDFGLVAAETGHLVFGTLHAATVPQSIGRILGLFPTDQHRALRQGLEFNLRSIICQKLLVSCKEGIGRVPVNEVMIANAAIRKLLKDGEDKKIMEIMKRREDGMMSFDQCLCDRVNQGLVDKVTALGVASNPDQLEMAFSGLDLMGG
jgi:twitching motility protein PilT